MKREEQKEQTAFRHLLKRHGHAAFDIELPEVDKLENENQGNVKDLLTSFNIDTLDFFETMQYNQLLAHSSKVEALQILINNVEGDCSQLSEGLRGIAEMQGN